MRDRVRPARTEIGRGNVDRASTAAPPTVRCRASRTAIRDSNAQPSSGCSSSNRVRLSRAGDSFERNDFDEFRKTEVAEPSAKSRIRSQQYPAVRDCSCSDEQVAFAEGDRRLASLAMRVNASGHRPSLVSVVVEAQRCHAVQEHLQSDFLLASTTLEPEQLDATAKLIDRDDRDVCTLFLDDLGHTLDDARVSLPCFTMEELRDDAGVE